jgi:hypothetical protein
MPRTISDVENYLLKLGRKYESDGDTLLLRASADVPPIALRVNAPVLMATAAIGPVPTDAAHRLPVYERLLELNASDLMHASYGLDNGQIVLSAALALENLDDNELDAAIGDIDLALLQHTSELMKLSRN